jgi:hypothetical protein
MIRFDTAIGFSAAAIASVAAMPSARAVEIEQLLGRWSVLEYDECAYPDDSEAAPLKISKDEDGTHIGNYGWLCTVRDWTKDGSFLVGTARDCGAEGGDDPFDQEFQLGLNDKDELLMSKDDTTGLRRCPAAQ